MHGETYGDYLFILLFIYYVIFTQINDGQRDSSHIRTAVELGSICIYENNLIRIIGCCSLTYLQTRFVDKLKQ